MNHKIGGSLYSAKGGWQLGVLPRLTGKAMVASPQAFRRKFSRNLGGV